MVEEIHRRRGPVIVRLHDTGDFFSDNYVKAWLSIMGACPGARFYCYTKEVKRFRRLVEPCSPGNFAFVYSFGSLASSNCCCRSRVSTGPCCSPGCQSDRTTATGRTCRPPPTRGPAQVL